jgi:hypothetical protein
VHVEAGDEATMRSKEIRAARRVNAKTPRVGLHDDHLGGRGTVHEHVSEVLIWVMCAMQATTYDGVLDEVFDKFTDVYISFRDAPKASLFDARAFTVLLPASPVTRKPSYGTSHSSSDSKKSGSSSSSKSRSCSSSLAPSVCTRSGMSLSPDSSTSSQ